MRTSLREELGEVFEGMYILIEWQAKELFREVLTSFFFISVQGRGKPKGSELFFVKLWGEFGLNQP